MAHRRVLDLQLAAAQATLAVVERASHDQLDLGVAERVQTEDAHAGEQCSVHLERRILGRRPDQGYGPVLGVWQHRVLLRLVPAVDLVDEQDGALVRRATGFLDGLAQVGHTGGHRGHGDEARAGQTGDDFGQRLLNGLQQHRVLTDHVTVTEGISSGGAIILVDRKGENSIVVVPGANANTAVVMALTGIPTRLGIGNGQSAVLRSQSRLYSPAASNPALRRIRRTFFGDTDNFCATREILRPSRIQTFGITISANSSVTC